MAVKYFAPEQIENYQKGSFRLGTLSEYRKNDWDQDRFSDESEGTWESIIGRGEGEIRELNVGPHQIRNMKLIPLGPIGSPLYNVWKECNPAAVQVSNHYDCNVFCCSRGSYSREHHELMMFGDGEYKGDPNLPGYVELDLPEFVVALDEWARGNTRYFEVANGTVNIIKVDSVKYSIRTEEIGYEDARHWASDRDRRFMKATFTKPERFQVENEIRVALTTHPANHQDLHVPIFPCSDGLRMSLRHMPKLYE